MSKILSIGAIWMMCPMNFMKWIVMEKWWRFSIYHWRPQQLGVKKLGNMRSTCRLFKRGDKYGIRSLIVYEWDWLVKNHALFLLAQQWASLPAWLIVANDAFCMLGRCPFWFMKSVSIMAPFVYRGMELHAPLLSIGRVIDQLPKIGTFVAISFHGQN